MSLRILANRTFSFFLCFCIANLAFPESPLLAVGLPIRDAIGRKIAADAEVRSALAKRRAASHTRALDAKELTGLQGRTAQCPYTAGASKWDPSFQGVDLVTGNYTTCATDLSFDGGYGIPVNITRSYSANDANEGPFGFGWSLSADVRTTAGGILKSKSAPVRSVPITFKERAPLEKDPNLTLPAQPVEAVTAEDASGKQETIQKDADGVLSPAAWDLNQSVCTYANVIQGGLVYQVMTGQTMTTPDGTVYQYQVEGSYTGGGTLPYNAAQITPAPTATPANVLKCVSATDRNGNMTTYSYGSGNVTFNKVDGTTSEHPLTSVQMPNGHIITLTWGNGTNGPVNRVIKVNDNGSARVVNYAYSSGNLYSVTSPAGLTTYYGYSTPVNNIPGSTDVSNPVLSSITDPRGLTTGISSFVGVSTVLPYNAQVEAVVTYLVTAPNGVATEFHFDADATIEPIQLSGGSGEIYTCYLLQHSGGLNAAVIGTYYDMASVNANSVLVMECPNLPLNILSGVTIAPSATYDVFTQNCLQTNSYWEPAGVIGNTLSDSRLLNNSPYSFEATISSTSYNFLGKPLDVTVQEYETPVYKGVPFQGTPNLLRTAITSYAYWDATKYYQQKAVKDPGGRISFTDYYTSTDATLGNRGQAYEVFDPKYGQTQATVSGPYSVTVPSGSMPTGADSWRYLASPASSSEYSAKFVYDSKGRATTVYKLQAATAGTPSTYRYVTTQTTYGADTDGSWGQASQVVEDSGGINRTCKNLGYTSWGKADDVIDGSGHEFQTSYDADGKVLSVTQVGVGPVATYSYGTSGITNGQVVSVADNLSNVTQTLAYQTTSGGGLGQVASVSESRSGALDNVASYSYDGFGNRASATYRDGSSHLLAQWGYFDYLGIGQGTKLNYGFQTLCKLDGNGNRTAEEFHYSFDSAGRVLEATFAQTPSNNTPDSSGYYDGHLASARARAHYEYDAGGRLYWIAHYWDTLNTGGTAYTSEAILANGADYEENTGLNRGVKLDSKTYTRTTPGQPNWTLSQTDSYSYDASLDYLTGASYGDGLANANPTWSYDAAGNRNDAVTDNLNRATSIGGVSRTSDILGNTLGDGTHTYTWDAVNRLTSAASSGVTTSYVYRADGMRVSKANSTAGTSYRYDGQMGIEDIDYAFGGNGSQPTVTKVTDYGIGARGLDAMYVTQSGSTTANYPIYDAHGNMVTTLARSGTSGYTFASPRSYDAWGLIRVGAQTGDPKGRYCANLGHKQDDESGLVYMRARYFEPTSGRFISEDEHCQSINWFAYCLNNPVSRLDSNGKDFVEDLLQNAFNYFMSVPVWGSTSGIARHELENFIIYLKDIVFKAEQRGEELISDGEADEVVASGMGSASEMQSKIGEIKQGIGSMNLATGTAAKLAIATIRIMMELLSDGDEPWNWKNS